MHRQPEDERVKYEAVWRHNDYRKFSPGLQALTSSNLIDFFRHMGVTSILDAGCGSGQVMEWLMTHHPSEFRVHGFDIAANCLNPFFAGRESEVLSIGCLWAEGDIPQGFDAVFCTDVMEHIPPEHVDTVLSNVRRAAGKAAFFGIALFEDHFGPVLIGSPLHLTVRPAEWWIERLVCAGFQIEGQSVIKDKNEKPMWLYVAATLKPCDE
jgi:SAM-dependent methyltransferase